MRGGAGAGGRAFAGAVWRAVERGPKRAAEWGPKKVLLKVVLMERKKARTKVGMKVDRMVLQWVDEMDECKVREKVALKGIVEVVCWAYM